MKLRELREKNNNSQKDIAELLGCSITQISSYERGRSSPNPKNLCKLANYFSVSVDYLIGREINEQTTQMTLSKTDYKLISDFYSLSENEREKVLIYIKAITDNKKE